jgi:hypothetical protein
MNLSYSNSSEYLLTTNITNNSFYELIYNNNNNNEKLYLANYENSILFNISLSDEENSVNNVFIEFRDQSRFWIQRVLVPIITMVGVMGNCMTIVIMTRKRMRSSTNSYLAALAIFDMLYLIFTFVLSLSHYPNSNHTRYYYYWLFWPLAVFICDTSSNISIWLTVTFTIERYNLWIFLKLFLFHCSWFVNIYLIKLFFNINKLLNATHSTVSSFFLKIMLFR